MRKLLWFNAIAAVLFLLFWLGIYGWWHFAMSQMFLKQLPQDVVENVKAITDLDHLRKLNLLLIDKDRSNITQMNNLLDKSVAAYRSLMQLSFFLFLVNSIWLYRLLRAQSIAKLDDRSSSAPQEPPHAS
jgi:hypothetical protein